MWLITVYVDAVNFERVRAGKDFEGLLVPKGSRCIQVSVPNVNVSSLYSTGYVHVRN